MPGLDDALRSLGSGEPAVLFDEERDGVAYLVDGVKDDQTRPLSWAADLDGAPTLWRAALGTGDPVPSGVVDPALARVALHGVLDRASEAEAAVDAMRLAGRAPAAWLTRLSLPAGVLAKPTAARDWADRHGYALFSVQDVVAARLANETIVEPVASARLPSLYAEAPLEVRAYRSLIDGVEHLALVHGPLGRRPLVRLHSECLTGDALGSLRCDCGDQLRRALQLIAVHPEGGVVIYLRGQEGRGIGLANKIRAYALQDHGLDTVEANVELGFPADARTYGAAVQMLRYLGIGSVRLLTNNPAKSRSLDRYGIEVAEAVPLRIDPNAHNAGYLDTKRRKMGHAFAEPPAASATAAAPSRRVREDRD